MLGKSAALKNIWGGGREGRYLRAASSESASQDSLYHKRAEGERRRKNSIWINSTMNNIYMYIFHRCALSLESRSMSAAQVQYLDCSSGTGIGNRAVIRMNSSWTANAALEILNKFHDSQPRLSSLLLWFSCEQLLSRWFVYSLTNSSHPVGWQSRHIRLAYAFGVFDREQCCTKKFLLNV